MTTKVYFLIKMAALSLTVFVLGCSTFSKSKQNSLQAQAPRMTPALTQEQKKLQVEELKQNRKDQAILMTKKSQIEKIKLRSQVPSKDVIMLEMTEAQLAQLSENDLYNELVLHSERNDELGFQSRLQMFKKRFPQSPLMDDAIYLSGMIQIANKNYGQALIVMNEIIKKYPYGNKVSGALFAKASVYKKMNLEALARDVYQSVVVRYPGSPESVRAENELRLISTQL